MALTRARISGVSVEGAGWRAPVTVTGATTRPEARRGFIDRLGLPEPAVGWVAAGTGSVPTPAGAPCAQAGAAAPSSRAAARRPKDVDGWAMI